LFIAFPAYFNLFVFFALFTDFVVKLVEVKVYKILSFVNFSILLNKLLKKYKHRLSLLQQNRISRRLVLLAALTIQVKFVKEKKLDNFPRP
jgi:hypothetical protein